MRKPLARPPRSPKSIGTGQSWPPTRTFLVVATVVFLGAIIALLKWIGGPTTPPPGGDERPQVTFNWWEDRGAARSKICMKNTSDFTVTGARLVSDTPGWEWQLPKDGSGRTLNPGQIYWAGGYPKKPKGAEPSVRFICDQQR